MDQARLNEILRIIEEALRTKDAIPSVELIDELTELCENDSDGELSFESHYEARELVASLRELNNEDLEEVIHNLDKELNYYEFSIEDQAAGAQALINNEDLELEASETAIFDLADTLNDGDPSGDGVTDDDLLKVDALIDDIEEITGLDRNFILAAGYLINGRDKFRDVTPTTETNDTNTNSGDGDGTGNDATAGDKKEVTTEE